MGWGLLGFIILFLIGVKGIRKTEEAIDSFSDFEEKTD